MSTDFKSMALFLVKSAIAFGACGKTRDIRFK